jgi:hypothetical protein
MPDRGAVEAEFRQAAGGGVDQLLTPGLGQIAGEFRRSGHGLILGSLAF